MGQHSVFNVPFPLDMCCQEIETSRRTDDYNTLCGRFLNPRVCDEAKGKNGYYLSAEVFSESPMCLLRGLELLFNEYHHVFDVGASCNSSMIGGFFVIRIFEDMFEYVSEGFASTLALQHNIRHIY